MTQQAAALRAQAGELEREGRPPAPGSELKQGADLKEQAAELQAEADAANQQKQRALRLQAELTNILTRAGGDDRNTDHRVVQVQDALDATPGVVGQFAPQINDAGDAAPRSRGEHRRRPRPRTWSGRSEMCCRTRRRTRASRRTSADRPRRTWTWPRRSGNGPIVIATVVGLSFLLLMVAFHSLTVPLQAAVTNLLSVAAALGVLTAVFQWGWGLSLIGLDAPHGTVPIASYVPLMMFAVLFGLSMDYEVFLMSRIEQQHTGGKPPREAVPRGSAPARG